MEISDFLSEAMIITDLDADNKRQVLEKVAEFAAKECALDKNAVFEAILERENLGSTGYGNGVALPHARIAGLSDMFAVFARLHKAVEYDTLDNKPVDLIALVISPENSGNDHLQALALFSRVLKNENACQKIRMAKNSYEILQVLES